MPTRKPTQKEIARINSQGIAGIAEVIDMDQQFTRDKGGRLYRYKDGVYVPNGEEFIICQVKELLSMAGLGNKWTSRKAREVTEYIRADAPMLWTEPPVDVVNVANGLVDVKHGKLSPHRPDYFSTVQLPVSFDPTATCPAWDKFIADVFPADAHHLPYEIVAWLMVPYRRIQKAILLLGEGSNGKSTFLRAVIAFLGKENVCTLSLHKLENDRFATSRLIGKLANICPDLPNKKLETTSAFKAITGGDVVMAEHKFRDSFDFSPFARLVFSANELPCSADTTEGFYRRLIIVPFERTFKENPETGRQLDSALSDPKELSGVLNEALAALPVVLERGLTIPPSIKAAHQEYRNLSDPLAEWLDSETVKDPDGWVPKAALFGSYAQDCRNHRRMPMTQASFGRRLKRLRKVKDTQRTDNGKMTWGYAGIRFADGSIHGVH
jgi:putative DNA primase/helicase